jgi:thioredoxin reductase (NADPH)
VEKVAEHPAIEVLPYSAPIAFKGDGKLQTVVLRNSQTLETSEHHPAGVFVFIGLTPNTGIVAGTVETDDRGFIVTDMALMTNVPGIFAAGDCREGSTKQAASAAGEGAAAALAIRRYIQPLASGMPVHAEEMSAPA